MKLFLAIFMLILVQSAYAVCDYEAEILLDSANFSSDQFSFKLSAEKVEGTSTNISAIVKIVDSNGQIAKEYNPWQNASITRQKTTSSYSPNLKGGKFDILAEITVQCEDTNLDNNKDQRTVDIIGNPTTEADKDTDKESETQESSNEQTQQFDESKIIHLSEKDIEEAKGTEVTYKSSSDKAKHIALYILLLASILLNIYLILKIKNQKPF